MRDKFKILFILLKQAYDEWKTEVWPYQLDQPICCDGKECGCFSRSIRQTYLGEDIYEK